MNGANHDITILRKVSVITKQGVRRYGRLYYYQGNFFFPIAMPKKEEKRVAKAMRIWAYRNKKRILADRSRPEYKSFETLIDEV